MEKYNRTIPLMLVFKSRNPEKCYLNANALLKAFISFIRLIGSVSSCVLLYVFHLKGSVSCHNKYMSVMRKCSFVFSIYKCIFSRVLNARKQYLMIILSYYWCFSFIQNWSSFLYWQFLLLVLIRKWADMLFSHTVYLFSSSSGITPVLYFVLMVCFCLVITVITEWVKSFLVFSALW